MFLDGRKNEVAQLRLKKKLWHNGYNENDINVRNLHISACGDTVGAMSFQVGRELIYKIEK